MFLYNIAQEEDQIEWTKKEINILKKKFGTNIKNFLKGKPGLTYKNIL